MLRFIKQVFLVLVLLFGRALAAYTSLNKQHAQPEKHLLI